MSAVIYTFGPQALSDSAMALKTAISEIYPAYQFDIEMVGTSTGTREGVVVSETRCMSGRIHQLMINFARGFVAGYGYISEPPVTVTVNSNDSLLKHLAAPETPATKARTLKPATLPSTLAPTLPSIRKCEISKPRRHTVLGLPLPSNS